MDLTGAPRSSWICRDAFERARFLDLHRRLLPVNVKVLLVLVAVVAAGFWSIDHPRAMLPGMVGVVLFGIVQRNAERFARPELWVFAALLGAEAMIVAAITLNGSAQTPAIALVAWPVVGLACRFHNRVVVVGTVYVIVLVAGAIIASDPAVVREDPLTLGILLVALFAVTAAAAVHRDSDIENRGAAILDPLTGMLNRTALTRRTEEIEHQSRLTGEPVGVILLDLDRFKSVNDTHGHVIGDAVLRESAYTVRRELRAYDLAYRLGGEEFAIVLAGSDIDATAGLAERIRRAVAACDSGGVGATVSIGVAASKPGGPFLWAEVYKHADAALYRAKGEVRDRVVVDAIPVAA